jgi:hypothetical protein
MTAKPFHPLADLLPLLQGAEFDRLVADIAEQGLLNAITLYQGQILDGRNREKSALRSLRHRLRQCPRAKRNGQSFWSTLRGIMISRRRQGSAPTPLSITR